MRTVTFAAWCWLAGFMVSVPCAPAHAQDAARFPYQGIIGADQAVVRCGPDEVHYGTQELPAGEVVLVYREDPGGWLAIRPLENSFSLVPESAIEMVREGVGKVLHGGTRVWVGTHLGAVEQPLWQIKLRQDEQVAVLGELSWVNEEGQANIWYQIEPPAGEFRWIHESDLNRLADELPETQPLDAPTVPGPSPEDPQARNSLITMPADVETPVRPEETTFARTAQPDSNAPSTTETSETANAPDAPQLTEQDLNSGWRKSTRIIGKPSQPYQPASSPAGPRTASVNNNRLEMASRLNASRAGLPPIATVAMLDSVLSRQMATLPPQQWNIDGLRQSANQLGQANLSPQDRQQLNRIAAKLNQCDQLAKAYRTQPAAASSATAAPFRRANPPTGNSNSPTGVGAAPAAAQFDASGWLNVLTQGNGTQPSTYVLQDDAGRITHHLAPAPGINIQRYLKTRIGVTGKRGFHQRLQLPHVSVERVYPLGQSSAVNPAQF